MIKIKNIPKDYMKLKTKEERLARLSGFRVGAEFWEKQERKLDKHFEVLHDKTLWI